MTISIPLRSNARKQKATTQWVTRTVAVYRIAGAGIVATVAAEEEPKFNAWAESAMVAQICIYRSEIQERFWLATRFVKKG